MKPSQRRTPPRLDETEIKKVLAALPGWSRIAGTIRRPFRFADFPAAFAFMTKVAALAEQMQHHPDWRNRGCDVYVTLSTHDAGGLTILDLELARAIDGVAPS